MYFKLGYYYARAMLPRNLGSVLHTTKEGLFNMARFLYRNLSEILRKWGNAILAFSWLLGLAAGCGLYADVEDSFLSLMPGTINSPLSIVSLLISVFLPLLFAAFAVYISRPEWLVCLCFLKACAVSFVFSGLSAAFGSGAWLVRFLVLFHDLFASVLLLIFSMRHIHSGKSLTFGSICSVLLPGVLAAAAQCYCVAPFLADCI